jgi:hypothetical protein
MSGLIHTGLGSSSIIAHVVLSPPPPANSFVIGPAVINTHTLWGRLGPRGCENARMSAQLEGQDGIAGHNKEGKIAVSVRETLETWADTHA